MIQIASGAIPVLPPDNPVNISTSGVASGTTIYTVPEDTTFYCTGIKINRDGSDTNMSIEVNGTTKYADYVVNHVGITVTGSPLFVATSEQEVKFIHAGANVDIINMWGFLQ